VVLVGAGAGAGPTLDFLEALPVNSAPLPQAVKNSPTNTDVVKKRTIENVLAITTTSPQQLGINNNFRLPR
jgi:hypothetical protein